MTLRLSLVIDGNQAGAARALKDTAAQTDDLARAAASAQSRVASIAPAAAGAGAAIKGSAFQTANLAAQIQDIVVQMQSGQNPFQIALQQGTQITQVIGQKGAAGAVALMGEAFESLINPVSLATIGIIALGGFAVQALASIGSGAQATELALAQHKTLIDNITKAYPEAAAAAKRYEDQAALLTPNQALSEATDDLKVQTAAYGKAKAALEGALKADLAATNGDSYTVDANGSLVFATKVHDAAQQAIQDFLDTGGSVRDLQDRLAQLKIPTALGSDTNKEISSFQALVDKVAKFTANVQGAGAAIKSLPQTVSLDFSAIASGNPGADPAGNHSAFAADQLAAGGKSKAAYDLQREAISALAPSQQAEIARKQKALDLDGEALTAARRQQEIEQAGALAYAQASHTIALADQERLRAANDNIAALQTNIDVIGKSVGETARLQFVQQQLASAYSAAAQSGTTVSEGYIASIRKTADEVGKLQQKLAETQTLSDLAFERSQLGRSDGEQGVASALRGLYGDDYQSQMDGAIAGQIRLNDALSTSKDLATSFASTLSNDLQQGKSPVDALTDSFGKLEQQLIQMALNQAIAGLLSHLNFSGAPSPGNFSIGGTATYDEGGYTGPGGRLQAAGIVHKGEVVWSQDDVRRHGGPSVVDAMRRGLSGYDRGGFVGAVASGTSSGGGYGGSGGGRMVLEVNVTTDDDGKLVAVARQAGGDAGAQAVIVHGPGMVRQQLASPASNSVMRSKYGLSPRTRTRGG